MPKIWDYLNSISAGVRKVFDIISSCCLCCLLHELNSFLTHGKVAAQDMTPVATSRTCTSFLNVDLGLWVVLVCIVASALVCSFICYLVWKVRISLYVFLSYILHRIISFLLRSSFYLRRSELQLDSWVRPEKEWFPMRTRDTVECCAVWHFLPWFLSAKIWHERRSTCAG